VSSIFWRANICLPEKPNLLPTFVIYGEFITKAEFFHLVRANSNARQILKEVFDGKG